MTASYRSDALDSDVCVVVTSIGRPRRLRRLFDSLGSQTRRDFGVVVVDQSDDGCLAPLCVDGAYAFGVHYKSCPGERGASRGRNVGLRLTRGRYVVFPDDDCWYPPEFLARALGALEADVACAAVSGRPVGADGRTINGRFETRPCTVDRKSVWTTQIEWLAVYRRAAILETGGFDERIGVGAATRWQSSEAQDVVLRLLERGMRVRYDPTLTGCHEEFDLRVPTAPARLKGRRYARGMGHVLALHGYGLLTASVWVARPTLLILACAVRLKPRRAAYYANVALGRLEGYLSTPVGATPPTPARVHVSAPSPAPGETPE